MQRKKILLSMVLLLLLSSLIAFLFSNLANANPMIISDNLGIISPDSKTKPPIVSMLTPENNTAYTTNIISFSINVSVGESSTASSKFIRKVYYKADWQIENTSIYEFNPTNSSVITEPIITKLYKTFNLTGIPDGFHSFTVYSEEKGSYYSHTDERLPFLYEYYYLFEINGSSTVFFTVDTTSPNIAVLSPQNTISSPSDVKLSFVVNESTSRIAYSLDAQENVTTSGNTTLTDLSAGEHTVKVYAWDTAGNVGASETVAFIVAESFPTSIVLAVSIAVVAVVLTVVVLLYKKHRSQVKKV